MRKELVLINEVLDKTKELANTTIKVGYEASYEEAQKILQIKRYAEAILKYIS